MWPYYLLLIVPIVLIVGFELKNKFQEQRGVFNEPNRCILPTFFGMLFVLLACRSETVGNDLPAYQYMFGESLQMSRLGEVFSLSSEYLFNLLNYGVTRITDNFNWYLGMVAVIEILPIAYVYCQDSRNAYLKIILFLNMSTFTMLFSGIRQTMALALGVLAYNFVKHDKKIAFCVFALAAMFMHHSGFLVWLLWPLYRMRLKRKHMYVIVPAFLGALALNGPIFNFLTRFLAGSNEKYANAEASATGAFTSLILFAMFAAFAYIVSDEKRIDDETYGLRNILLFTVLLQCFAPIHLLAMRMNYYFIIFTPLAIAKCVAVPKPGLTNFALYGKYVLCAFFTYYYCSSVYAGYQMFVRNGARTWDNMLGAMPYAPFWMN